MDSKSVLGYSRNSPYQNDPYIDIFTPEGYIDMSNTPKDLIGIDNKGNQKKMKAFSKNPYKFEGDMVREIPVGNPFMQKGGMNLYSYLFDDDEEEAPKENVPTAPSTDEVEQNEGMMRLQQKQQQEQEDYDLAMSIANEDFTEGNPYKPRERRSSTESSTSFPAGTNTGGVNPTVIQNQNDLMSKYNLSNLGIWGDKAHQKRKSNHNTGDAQDFAFDTPETANAAINQLMTEAQQRNVKYIVYNKQIWNPSISPDWRPYKGTNPHTTHFHVSYNR